MSHYAIFLCSKHNMLLICPLLLCPLLSLLIHKCWNIFPQVRDYSGMYTVKLIPCTAPPGVEYSFHPVCHPREPITFDLDIRFQQVITESQELVKGVTAKAQRFPLSLSVCACVCVCARVCVCVRACVCVCACVENAVSYSLQDAYLTYLFVKPASQK